MRLDLSFLFAVVFHFCPPFVYFAAPAAPPASENRQRLESPRLLLGAVSVQNQFVALLSALRSHLVIHRLAES